MSETTTGAATTAAPQVITPEQLGARFGDKGTRRDDELRCSIASGYCGLSVIGDRDRMVSGFDDGYDFMGYLEERGWRAMADKGDWPYVVYLGYDPREPYAVAEYCECDFTLWTFDDAAAAVAFVKTLPDES